MVGVNGGQVSGSFATLVVSIVLLSRGAGPGVRLPWSSRAPPASPSPSA